MAWVPPALLSLSLLVHLSLTLFVHFAFRTRPFVRRFRAVRDVVGASAGVDGPAVGVVVVIRLGWARQ